MWQRLLVLSNIHAVCVLLGTQLVDNDQCPL